MSISLTSLRVAVEIKEEIALLEARLNKILGGEGVTSPIKTAAPQAPVKKGRKTMSAAARAKIAAAQKARWAKAKK